MRSHIGWRGEQVSPELDTGRYVNEGAAPISGVDCEILPRLER